jgi:hypothetical protein
MTRAARGGEAPPRGRLARMAMRSVIFKAVGAGAVMGYLLSPIAKATSEAGRRVLKADRPRSMY